MAGAFGPPRGPGRTYSAWDWDLMRYRVYQGRGEPADVGGWNFRPQPVRRAAASPIGVPVEAVLRELPMGARFVGTSDVAVGEVVVRNRHAALWSRRNVPGGAGLQGTGADDAPPGPSRILWAGLGALLLALWWRARQALR